MADFPGLGHVALTVKSVDASRGWYAKLFGAEPVLDENTGPWHHVVWSLPGGTLIGIHEHPSTPADDTFSEYRLGLDHLSFHVGSRDELAEWADRLDQLGIKHSAIEDAPYGSGVSFRDPDGNALEFFTGPG